MSGKSRNRPALRVRDLARGTERALPVPGPLSGPETITRGQWAWSPDSRQSAMLVTHGISSGYVELMTVDPTTGAATPGVVLATGRSVSSWGLDFDQSSRYLLFALQDTHSVSTWWSAGGKPARSKRIGIGNQVPANVAGAYAGGDW